MNKKEIVYFDVDHIPVAICMPEKINAKKTLAIWLPYLGGDRETVIPHLQKLASNGYYAISIDPYLHGVRNGSVDIRERVFKNFRREMWPITGYTTLDILKIADWAIAEYKLNDKIVAGGLSMGGDIAISLAGIDPRIQRVATVGASPDWERPGMTDISDTGCIIDQGPATAQGKWFYEKLNPMNHVESYAHLPQMYFELGAMDSHISPEWSIAFKHTLCRYYPDACNRIIINLNEGANHLELLQDEAIIDRAIDFLF